MDIYGDPISEIQARMYSEKCNKGLMSTFSRFKRILLLGDKFSTCSTTQKYAMIGQLGAVGRVNQWTFGYRLVEVVFPAIIGTEKHTRSTDPLVRGKMVPADSFIVLWAGGYNVWIDVDTLFSGLEMAMRENPRVYFLSVGGPAVNATGYQRFRDLAENSPERGRFIFLGWQPRREVLRLYGECDCGISVDAECYETELGTRTRLLEMIGSGLPVICSAGSETASIISREGFGLIFSSGNPKDLCRCIIELNLERSMGHNSRDSIMKSAPSKLAGIIMCKPAVEWCNNPFFAPDKGRVSKGDRLDSSLRGLIRNAMSRLIQFS
jgi:glycosyltransferase involved in cell wall biosynthesis